MRKKIKKIMKLWYIFAFLGVMLLVFLTKNRTSLDVTYNLGVLSTTAILISTGVCSLIYNFRQKQLKREFQKEHIRENICDNYCRFPELYSHESDAEILEQKCEKCPLQEIDTIV